MGDKIRPAFARSIPVTSCHGERSRPSARRLFAGCAEPLSVGIRAAVRRLRIDDPFRLARHLGSTVEFGSWPGWYAGVIELVAGLLIATGLFTRAVAFVASGEMAVAYFWMHQPYALWPIGGPPDGNGGTPAILFCFGFFLLVFTGGGIYSIDARRTVTA